MKAPMLMATGHVIEDVLHLRTEDVRIWDIAWSMQGMNRFGGHTPLAWSVCSHVGLAYQLALMDTKGNVNTLDALGLLLHDAAEPYLIDLPRPIKRLPEMAPFIEAEENILRVIFEAVGLGWDDVNWDFVKRYDDQALYVECRKFFPWMEKDPHMPPAVYPMPNLPNFAIGTAKAFVDFIRPMVINVRSAKGLPTNTVNTLFALSDTLRPYADPEAQKEAEQPKNPQAQWDIPSSALTEEL